MASEKAALQDLRVEDQQHRRYLSKPAIPGPGGYHRGETPLREEDPNHGHHPQAFGDPRAAGFYRPPMGAPNEEIYRGLLKFMAEEYGGLQKQAGV